MACCARKNHHHNHHRNANKAKIEDRKFVPKYSEKALTEKFYSKYEHIDSSIPISSDIASQIEEYAHKDYRKMYFAPVTENQVYGWYGDLASRLAGDGNDLGIIYFPRKTDEQISTLTKINVKQFGIK